MTAPALVRLELSQIPRLGNEYDIGGARGFQRRDLADANTGVAYQFAAELGCDVAQFIKPALGHCLPAAQMSLVSVHAAAQPNYFSAASAFRTLSVMSMRGLR